MRSAIVTPICPRSSTGSPVESGIAPGIAGQKFVTVVKSILRWLALVGLAGLAAATLATFLAGFLWLFDLFSHFRLQYVVVAVLLMLLLAWTRPRWAALAALLFGVWHGYVYLDVPGARVADTCDSETVDLLAFNLLYRNERKEAAIAYIVDSGADIVVLEENTESWATHLEALAETYPYRVPENWRDADGPTVLSRLPILSVEAVKPFEHDTLGADSDLGSFAASKWYLVVQLDAGGRDVTLIAVHPPYPNGTRLTSLRNGYLADAAVRAGQEPAPTIMVGDFNTTPWSPVFDDVAALGALGSAGATHTIYPATWPSYFPALRIPIDHVLVNDAVGVVSYERGPDRGSDHFPIRATLCIDPSTEGTS